MGGAGEHSLTRVLPVHVVVVITVTVIFHAIVSSILELFWDLPRSPVLRDPIQRWKSISGIHLENIEAGSKAKSADCHSLPESVPFDNIAVLVDDLALFEVECWIGVHAGRLHERLELVAGMTLRTLNAEDALNGILPEAGVAESVSHVRPFLLVSPFYFEFGTAIVVVVSRGGPILHVLFVVELLGLRNPFSRGLSPPVVILEEAIVQVFVITLVQFALVKSRGDVALLVEVLWADLGDVQVNHVAVVGINIEQFLFSQVRDTHVTIVGNVLMGQNHIRLVPFIAWCFHVSDAYVFFDLVLVNLEEEILFCDHLIQGVRS